MTEMQTVDDDELVELDYFLDKGSKIALIGYNGIQKFENVDTLPYTVDVFDRDKPFKEQQQILDEIKREYDGVVIISDRKRITNFEIPHVQLIPKDIIIELEIIAVLDRRNLVKSIQKFLDENNILEESINVLYLSDRARIKPDYDGVGIPLESVIRENFLLVNIKSLEDHYTETAKSKELENFRNYLLEPFPIEKYNLIQIYREDDILKFSKTLMVNVLNEEDALDYEFDSRLKQLILTTEEDFEKLDVLNLPQYLEFIILDDETKHDKLLEVIEKAKRGYDVLIVEHGESSNRVLADLIDYLNKYAERFKIRFSKNTSYLSQVGLPSDTNVAVLDCTKLKRDDYMEKLTRALKDDKIIVLENLPEDDEDLLDETWEVMKEYLPDDTPMAMYFAAGPIITQASLMTLNSIPYTASRILVGNKKTDRTRIDRFLMQKDS